MTDWEEDCSFWYGYVLTGPDCHWCLDFDGLPIDIWCDEYAFCYCEKPWYLELYRWLLNKYILFRTKDVVMEFSEKGQADE